MTVFEELKRRGLIAQMTHEDQIKKALENEKVTFYIGFDATADSLHVGHLLQIIVMMHMQRAGHRPIALLGTGTTMVGDPTGKTDMRKMLTKEQINSNAERFKAQISKFVDFTDDKALVLRNGDWLLKLNYMEFLRDIGVHFSVNRMLTAECFKSRLEKGLTFIEFNYMLMQSYDFLYLLQNYGCTLELGGDDQWSNIISGVDLARKVEKKEVYGMTFTLLTTKEGKKMGKTESGALWLDPEKVSPYDFFQYWRNIDDADVINCLKLMTFLPIEEIEAMESWEGSQLNEAKELLAFEVTKLVHGEEEALKAKEAARALFGAGVDSENMPTTALSDADFTEGAVTVADLLVKTGLANSKGAGRRLIEQGGISIGSEKVSDPFESVDRDDFAENGYIVLKKGKKVYHKVTL
ncbi:tyrosine--tRNA ligase [Candidatus Soleaferrea massiliensis]|uniref:tyrosine--tRNA ligase n=1 Tax=Candidatus Soleaferrea massiliensis TaxID=1470354 RepID=UPI000591107A|nr:tyrosine--tRNA ligase [Candidatus Soleaferrea massiliensis]